MTLPIPRKFEARIEWFFIYTYNTKLGFLYGNLNIVIFIFYYVYMKARKYTSHNLSIQCKGKSNFRITFVWNKNNILHNHKKTMLISKILCTIHIRRSYYINIYVNCNMLSSGYRKINPLQPKSECCIWLLLFTQNPHSSIEIEWKIKL